MNKVLFSTLLFFILILFSQCGPTTKDAANYSEAITSEQQLVIKAIDKLEETLVSYNPELISDELEKAKAQLMNSMSSLEKLGGFDKKNDFYDATMNLYKMFEKHLNNEYAEQLEIYKLPKEKYTKEKEDRFRELSNIIDNDYNIISEKVILEQKKFIDTWDLQMK